MKKLLYGGKWFGFFVLLLTFAWMIERAVADTDEIETEFIVSWDNSSKLNLTTPLNSPNGARRPKIAAAPNGSNVMVVFNHQQSASAANNDPYYVFSGNNGTTWSAPAPIFTSNGVNSIQPSVDYDDASKAHAVWIEGEKKLYYAQQDSWPTGFVSIKEVVSSEEFIDSPKIVASSSTTIDVVWVEKNNSSIAPDVYHARSTNGGSSWTSLSSGYLKTVKDSGFPDMLVRGSTIHLVWQEEITTGRRRIQYARSNDGGASWTTPTTISDNGNTKSAERPSIVFKSGRLEVVYSERSVGSLADQSIRYVSCISNCSLGGNWSDSTKASGFDVGANSNNSEVIISSALVIDRCTLISFHGTEDGLPDNNEIVFNTTKCEGAGWTFAREVTPSSIRSLRPVMATHDNLIYLAYTQAGDGVSSEDQIQFIIGRLEENDTPDNPTNLFMPIIAN